MSPLLITTFLLLFTISHQQDFLQAQTLQQLANVEDAKPEMSTRFGEKYDEALEAIFSVAIRLEALLSDSGSRTSKNFMVSPISMAVCVGELMLGARGKLQKELADLLVLDSNTNNNISQSVRHIKDGGNSGLSYYTLHEQLGDLMQNLQKRGEIEKTYILKTASVIFAQHNLTIKPEFQRNIQKFYGTGVQRLDFLGDPLGSEKIINTWASTNTQGVIKSLLPGPLPPQTLAILANAVYFKGEWEIPFSSEINRKGFFKTSPQTTVNVTYMMGEFENYKYFDSKKHKCRMVIIPYLNKEINMYIILPNVDGGKEYNINQFSASLRIKDIRSMISKAKQRKVLMVLPKMSLSNTINVLEPLRKYHAYKTQIEEQNSIDNKNKSVVEKLEEKVDLFQNVSKVLNSQRNLNRNSLDLGNISEDPRFQVSNIYQQMTLSINEFGTEAAAISASAIDYILEAVTFRVDRPFFFFIRHDATEASLFWGTIVDPTENKN